MPLRYATVDQFTLAYSVSGVTSAQLADYWLPYGTERVNAMLAGVFDVPFSSNNLTARNLAIDIAYYGIQARGRRSDEYKPLWDEVVSRMDALRQGRAAMVTTSGDAIYAAREGSGYEAWSTTQDFKPIFDLREPSEQRIDPDQLDDFDDRDS